VIPGLNWLVSRIPIRLERGEPGTTLWRGHLTETWWAGLPGAAKAETLITAPTLDTMIPTIAGMYQAPRLDGLAVDLRARPHM
jgi:hypothetical protein